MTLPLDDEALAPCPFCGGAAEIDYRRAYAEILSPHRISHQVAIYCLSCSAEIALDPIEINADPAVVTLELTECWNRRALATQALEAQRLREALQEMTEAFEPFASKPVGAPGSLARQEQARQIKAQFAARAALHPEPSEGETSE